MVCVHVKVTTLVYSPRVVMLTHKACIIRIFKTCNGGRRTTKNDDGNEVFSGSII